MSEIINCYSIEHMRRQFRLRLGRLSVCPAHPFDDESFSAFVLIVMQEIKCSQSSIPANVGYVVEGIGYSSAAPNIIFCC